MLQTTRKIKEYFKSLGLSCSVQARKDHHGENYDWEINYLWRNSQEALRQAFQKSKVNPPDFLKLSFMMHNKRFTLVAYFTDSPRSIRIGWKPGVTLKNFDF